MKKVLAILCVVLMLFSLAACGNDKFEAPNNSFNSAEIESYVSENKAELAQMISDEMGFEGDIDIKVQGKGIVFDIKTAIFDNVTEDIKLQLQEQASEVSEDYDEIVEEMKAEDERLSELEYITITLRDSDGTFIATASNR
ncbi:MAG: hypothetical protein IKB72_03465 [Ruminococcus sp.]|nr:hypothetical protein [Oscillospiraceae bacterium]MBR2724476.1 hypothetical protein [Ruminococcus sp.]